MTLDDALEVTLNALTDLPSGPDARKILAIIQAEAWDEGVRAKSEYAYSDDMEPLTNPYRPRP